MLALHACMGLKSVYPRPSHWCEKCLTRSIASLKTNFVLDLSFRAMSYFGNSSAGSIEKPSYDKGRVPQSPSLDSVALVAVLSRHAFLAPRQGGSLCEGIIRTYEAFLFGLITGVGSPWEFQLVLSDKLGFQWPALPIGEGMVLLDVAAYGWIGIGQLQAEL